MNVSARKRDSVPIQALLSSLDGRIPRIRPGPFYLLGLLLTTIGMVFIPICYMALIGLVGYAAYYHLRYDLAWFSTYHLSGRLAVAVFLFGYLGPAAVALITIFFMLKPFLARPEPGPEPLTLAPNQEPVLYSVLERLCQCIGARMPRQIVVDCTNNASASLGSGWLAFLRRDLTLSLGLPLAANLEVAPFLGVIAHELGHFSQRIGMRLSYIIRSVNAWLARAVYQRDHWDAVLIDMCSAEDNRLALIPYAARAVIFLVRQVLKIFMYAGHVISCFMMRQMEYNTDRYQAEIAGSAAFEATMRRLVEIDLIWPSMMQELQFAWREKRLPDNLPLLLRQRVEGAGEALSKAAMESMENEKPSLFATHPSGARRVQRARQPERAGVVQVAGPATALFSNFTMIAHAVTLTDYRTTYGLTVESANLVPTAKLVREHESIQRGISAMARFFQHCISLTRTWDLPESLPDASQHAKAMLAQLRSARSRFDAEAGTYRPLYDRYRALIAQRARLLAAQAVVRAGLTISPEEFEIADGSRESLEKAIRDCEGQLANLDRKLRVFDALQQTRLTRCLSLARLPQIRERARLSDHYVGQIGACWEALARLASIQSRLQPLRGDMDAILAVAQRGAEKKPDELPGLPGVIQTLGNQIEIVLSDLRCELENTQYPFTVAGQTVHLAGYAIERLPRNKDLGAVLSAASDAVEKLKACHGQTLGRLAEIAERVELVAGLPRLGDPPPLERP